MSGTAVFFVCLLTGTAAYCGPKNCEGQMISPKAIKQIKVACSPPVDLPALIEETRTSIDQRLGGPDKKLKNKDFPRQVFYREGGIAIVYHKNNESLVGSVTIYPENLDFTPEAILEFLNLTGSMEGELEQLTNDISWHGDPRFMQFFVTPKGNGGSKVDTIRITLNR